MARYEFKLPDIGEGIAEAEIVAWHVKVGDEIAEDQPIADLMTDKATVEMESPVAGKVVEVGGTVGDQVAIGSVLMVVETEGEADAQAPEEPLADGLAEVPDALEVPTTDIEPDERRTQADRRGAEADRRSEERGGEDRRVGEWRASAEPTDEDRRQGDRRSGEERRAQERASPDRRQGERRAGDVPAEGETAAAAEPMARPLASPAVRQRARDLGIDLAAVKFSGDRIRHADLDAYLLYQGGGMARGPVGRRTDEDVKVVGLRRRIAENLQEAKRRIPHFTYVDEVDVTALEQTRAMMNADRGDNPKLTMLPFLITGMCRTLTDYPQINATFDDDAGIIHRSGAVHMGMATQTDSGLAVPVIRHAESLDVWGIAREILRLAEATRAGKASREELSGSTITISSLGPMGGIVSTPVINRPEVAIIAVNKVKEMPVVVDGELEIRKMMNLSLSCDHRVVDGWDAASFIQDLKKLLENPLRLLSMR
ncbi:dihydrolipoamide acetyltransferase family protein [Sphingosinicella terrae]|uniref:dihydrolipoamide acetyltransferase family protein n=1 Tax=Sphingosinicella terrae TaxID=2172047 RepID=UPI000E0D1B16|nr:2-oxo acid dehydrogenase subunit E2 [Sphingosinicella terrae]